jgi:predicted TIM-barrel fold metal-dependent hydrolase
MPRFRPDFPIISADSHLTEPPEMWDRVEKRFRDRAPKYVRAEGGGVSFTIEGIPPGKIWTSGWYACGKKPEELAEALQRGWDAAPKSVWDPAERLKEQDIDGVAAEFMYTTAGVFIAAVKDADLLMACARAYNDYAAEYCSYDPVRLHGIGLVVLDDVDIAVAELTRAAKMGLKMGIPPTPLPDRPYSSREYDPFWAAAEEIGMPISLHAALPRGGVVKSQFSDAIVRYVHGILPVQEALTQLIMGGVFDRFPKLKVISVENDVSWISHYAHRLGRAVERFSGLQGIKLKRKAGDYIRDNVRMTFQFREGDDALAFSRKTLGDKALLWGSDYPHHDGTWPNSLEAIDAFRHEFPGDELYRVLNRNVSELYHLDTSALTVAQAA